jgi:hypothetical protein
MLHNLFIPVRHERLVADPNSFTHLRLFASRRPTYTEGPLDFRCTPPLFRLDQRDLLRYDLERRGDLDDPVFELGLDLVGLHPFRGTVQAHCRSSRGANSPPPYLLVAFCARSFIGRFYLRSSCRCVKFFIFIKG